jgi:hypothetical protein
MKASILFTLFCLLACLANGQTAPEGVSLRTTIFANKDKDAKAIMDRSKANTTADKQAVPPNRPMREVVFTNYKPGNTTQQASVARKATAGSQSLPSDKPAEKKRDSIATRIVIPDQGGAAPKTKN